MKAQPRVRLTCTSADAVARCAIFFCLCIQFECVALGEIPGLAIREVQICQDVKDHQPLNLLRDPDHRVKNAPVWVWLLLAGTEQSLTHLTSGKQIPVKTVWLYCGDDPTPKAEDGRSQDDQPMSLKELFARYPASYRKALPLGKISKFNALEGEAEEDHDGLWGWRTASQKISLSRGYYRIYFYLTQGGRLKLPDGKDYLIFNYEP